VETLEDKQQVVEEPPEQKRLVAKGTSNLGMLVIWLVEVSLIYLAL